MIGQCANPDCQKTFDYREGRFFRFHKAHRRDQPPPNTHSVQHFWLCGCCAGRYTLFYDDSLGVWMQRLAEIPDRTGHPDVIAAA